MRKTIKDIVSVKSEAALIKGVQLNWYEDPQQERENRRLASGYIFSSGKASPEGRRLSAMSIFERIRDSLNQPTSHNVFTVIANYGHGKSHFALVLANYFGRQPGDQVLEGVLRQVEACSNTNTAYHFRSFKENAQKPQLVICLSGADFTDLRQGFMQAARHSLCRHEQTRNYAIRSVSLRAAEWLKSLSNEQKARAQNYLVEHGLELDALIQSLNQFDLSMEEMARELSKVVLGVPADFGADLNLREIIIQLVDDLCTGNDAPFSKMVILFDELGIYSEKWCYNKMAAGGLAPQQIIEACDNRRGRVCLVGFLQRPMDEFVRHSPMQQEFKKWAERFPTETCFSLEAGLERVIEGLLTKSSDGIALIKAYMPQIEKACDAAWRILPYYQQRPNAWNEGNFLSTVGLGTVPFHPITTGLLCNLEFVQGERTIIGFVDESIRRVSDQPAVKEGTLNWILPTSLVDEFRNNFEGHAGHYDLYAHAQQRLGHNVDADFYLILKALFLFDVGKLKRYPSQAHERVLAHLCGLSEERVRELAKQLEEEYFVIRFSQARKEYEFAGIGTSPIEIRQQLQSEIAGKNIASLAQSLSVLNVLQQVGLPESEASGFKAEHAIEGDEWRLLPSLLDIRKLEVGTVRRLLSELQEKDAQRGLLICIVSSDGVELDNAKTAARRVLDEIRCSGHPCPIVIAVPKSPAVGVEREILMRDALNSWGEEKRKLYGEGFDLAMKDANRRLEDALRAHLKDLDYMGLQSFPARVLSASVPNSSKQQAYAHESNDDEYPDSKLARGPAAGALPPQLQGQGGNLEKPSVSDSQDRKTLERYPGCGAATASAPVPRQEHFVARIY
ncbi:MAG: hypothetical protein ABSB82_06265 [Terriglobia bacterium]|jgi:hypothetical protein